MVPDVMPKSLLVVGSGAIGIEFASFYRNLGAEVTAVEMVDRILPVEDEEISAFARKSFETQAMKILTASQVKSLRKGPTDIPPTFEPAVQQPHIQFDRAISADAHTVSQGMESTEQLRSGCGFTL